MAPKVAPKEAPSKKAVREKKKTLVEDLTFGLKNKNKSKKVQQFINRTELSVKASHGGAQQVKNKEAKEQTKIAKKLQEEELRVLFNDGLVNEFGKSKSKASASAASLGVTAASKEMQELLEGFSDDSDSDNEDNEKRKTTYMDSDSDNDVVFREKTIEDIIEEQRAKLALDGKQGTPVTAESFATWRKAKLEKKQADAEERMRLEALKKKGGKGLSVLSGKELFNFNASLFVDDDGALNDEDEKLYNSEFLRREKEEEERAKVEYERVSAEQERLAQLQQAELAALRHKYEEKRLHAAAATRKTIQLLGVIVNSIVFEDRDDDEDLAPFPREAPISLSAAKIVSASDVLLEVN